MGSRSLAADAALDLGPGPWRLRDETRETVIAERVDVAASFWARFRGLMGRAALEPGDGLYLAATSIHMFFMRFPIDALFVGPTLADGSRRVVATRGALPPWRGLVMPVSGADGVVELPHGTLVAAGVEVGDSLRFEPVAA